MYYISCGIMYTHLPAKMLCRTENVLHFAYKIQTIWMYRMLYFEPKVNSFFSFFSVFTIEFHFRPRTCARFTMHKHSIVFPLYFLSARRHRQKRQRMYFVDHFFWILPRFAYFEKCNYLQHWTVHNTANQPLFDCVWSLWQSKNHLTTRTKKSPAKWVVWQTVQKNKKMANF